MRKFENVDVIACLAAVMEVNTRHYKSDFQCDVQQFRDAAYHPNEENTRLLWLSRPNGTECFRERDAYLRESYAYQCWLYHAAAPDLFRAYAVEITGLHKGKVVGNLYELDYRRHAAMLQKAALPAAGVTLKFEDGTQVRYSPNDYTKRLCEIIAGRGPIVCKHWEPEHPEDLQELLRAAQKERQKYRSSKFRIGIKKGENPL